MPVSIRGSAGGSVTLSSGAAASDTTLTLPNTTGTVALTASPTFSGTVTATTVTSPASTALTIQSAGTTAMTVDTSQNVGIGTTSPTSKLTVNGAGTFLGGNLNLKLSRSNDSTFANYLAGYGAAGTAQFYYGYTSGNTDLYVYNVANGPMLFGINNGEVARFDTSGNLLVGTTAQLNGSYQSILNLKGGNINGIVIQTTVTSWSPLVALSTTGTLVGNISSNNTSLSYNTTSDYRLKENVTPMTTGLATVKALKPVTYDWISDKSAGEGFIAHELQNVIPHAVTGEKDAVNEDGSIKPQGVDYSKIVVHLVAAIKELSAKNDALEARLAALEAK